jgi:hypothetical protein
MSLRREDRHNFHYLRAIRHLPRTPSSTPFNNTASWTKIVGCLVTWATVSLYRLCRLNGILQSDTKNVATKGRGLFGRQSSSSSTGNIRGSQEVTTPRSDISQFSEGARPRPQPRKRSLDATREGSRLSIFGNTFAGTLGKTRKPPPRYSA